MKWPISYNCNICDRIYHEAIIHLTKMCDNKCPFCIDRSNKGVKENKPDIEAIIQTLYSINSYITEVTISGGEPFLFMEELKVLVNFIHYKLKKKITIMTALPKKCYNNQSDFYAILENIDCLCITPQHYNEIIASEIRGHQNTYDRQSFYKELKYKEKIKININCCYPYLFEKDEILKCILHYNRMGFTHINLCEMFKKDDMYVDIKKTLGLKMSSPFASGCKTEYNIKKLIPEYNGKFFIKRSCFLRTNKQKANFWDLIKMATRKLKSKPYFFGVIHENGQLASYWI